MRIACLLLLGLALCFTAGTAKAEDQSIPVRGRVLDPDGKPVAAAVVTVPSTLTWDDRTTRRPVARTTSGPDGRFELTFKKSDLSAFTTGGGSPGGNSWTHAQVAAAADGFGIAFARWNRTDADGQVVLSSSATTCRSKGGSWIPRASPSRA